MSSTGTPSNHLIECLPEAERAAILAECETVDLKQGINLFRAGGSAPHAYFPTTCVISRTITMFDGSVVEAATIGNEGMSGVYAVLGMGFYPSNAQAQIGGESLRIPTPALRRLCRSCAALDSTLRRYAAFSLRHAEQTIACNALHPIERRAARWLLMAHDRANGRDELPITQELLSQMLGVRRQSVTEAASTLQAAGLISYRRGMIRVLDRAGLELSSCECYAVVKTMYQRIVAKHCEDGDE
ncbi:MAG: Crp/Fnr family transcriptional regulator [Tepidisphaeraceae bacterium]